MKNTLRFSLPILTLALALGHSDPLHAEHERPFRAVGTAVWDDIFAGFGPGATFEGTGTGTHLGKFVQAGDLVFDGPPAAVIPGHGSVVFIAADGDELHFDYEGELDSTTGIGTGTLEFTGGTGGSRTRGGAAGFMRRLTFRAGR